MIHTPQQSVRDNAYYLGDMPLGMIILLFDSTKFYMVRLKQLESGTRNRRRAYRNADSPLARWTHACSSPTPLYVCNTLMIVFGSTMIRRDRKRFSSCSEMMGINTNGK